MRLTIDYPKTTIAGSCISSNDGSINDPHHHLLACLTYLQYHSWLLQEYLQHIRKQFRCRDISYITLNKESHVLEVPDGVADAMGESFDMVGHRKGFRRYMTEELKELVKDLAAAQDMREKALGGILQVRLLQPCCCMIQLFFCHSAAYVCPIFAGLYWSTTMRFMNTAVHSVCNTCLVHPLQPMHQTKLMPCMRAAGSFHQSDQAATCL